MSQSRTEPGASKEPWTQQATPLQQLQATSSCVRAVWKWSPSSPGSASHREPLQVLGWGAPGSGGWGGEPHHSTCKTESELEENPDHVRTRTGQLTHSPSSPRGRKIAAVLHFFSFILSLLLLWKNKLSSAWVRPARTLAQAPQFTAMNAVIRVPLLLS